ncbi:MAG: alpha-hydroxy-acid oxidizing protein [Lachnospiraceae bacterium]|nr:alpha-hydroxy-acid oxidizing protein [Lachnospiraceae bacterium]
MNYEEVLKEARNCIGDSCKVCPVCNGRGCRNRIPGPGAKGVGDTAIRNYDKWQEVRINMDTLHENVPVDTSLELFGKRFRYPFFAGPVGAVNMHYSDKYDDPAYNNVLVDACVKAGIVAFTGDGMNAEVVEGAAAAIRAAGGMGVPTIKPWNLETIREKLALVKQAGVFAIAMDVDAAGLPFLKNMQPPAGSKTVDELRRIAEMAEVPFVVKGVMTRKAALKAAEAGAAAIIVSNHGGRVLDQCPATAEVLPEIAEAVGDRMKILVDGGIRSGVDIFKALALGADGVLIARPFVTAVYGGGAEGVQCYVEKLGAELADTMAMCGASALDEISTDMIWRPYFR